MNKAELCQKVAEQSGLTKKEAAKVVNITFNTIMDALAEGERVHLVGFGSFEVKERASRQGRDFQTGQPTTVPPSKGVQFKAGSILKDAVK
ncbi:MAG: HU family DNA-binding protein [Oscillospiraceae bacterium]|nr:HU family DNA-binding protein [Oscillospiraceae bacterium]